MISLNDQFGDFIEYKVKLINDQKCIPLSTIYEELNIENNSKLEIKSSV